ncbi:EexN family lipoprotein [Bartonella sp. B23]
MNKIIITTLLLCAAIITAGCEKTYSVAEFKKDKKLMEEWGKKCEKMGLSSLKTPKNCQNIMQADMELFQEHHKNLVKEHLGDDQEQTKSEKKADSN